MSTLDTTALWSATSLAFDEKKLGAAGLSVRQRKLLALIAQPASIPQLAQRIALPDVEVQAALERFAKLGLAQSDAAAPINPMQIRSARANAAEEPASRMPLVIGMAVAALALVAALAWLLRSGNASVPTAVAPKAAPTALATATGTTDSADNKLPRSAAAASPAAPTPAPAPTAPPVGTGKTAAAAATASKSAAAPAAPAAPTASPLTTVAPVVSSSAPAPAPAVTAPSLAVAAPNAAPTTGSPAVAVVLPPPSIPIATPTLVTSPPPVAPATVAAAKAAPTPATAREIRLINRVEPGFPRGVDADRGTVRARLQVDSRGAVTGVEIIESTPPRVFDRTVRSALQQWRYEPTGDAFTTAAEISFSR